MNNTAILSRAWTIAWNNKILWLFALLSGCETSGINSLGQLLDSNFLYNPDLLTIVLITVTGVFAFVGFAVGVFAWLILISGINHLEKGRPLAWQESINTGATRFWRGVGISALLGVLPALVTLIILTWLGSPDYYYSPALIPVTLFLLLLGLPLTIFTNFAKASVAIENLGVRVALTRAWKLLEDNFKQSMVFALILTFLFLLVALVGGAIVLAMYNRYINTFPYHPSEPLLLLLLALCCLVPLVFIVSSLLGAFTTSAYTLLFLHLTKKPTLESTT